VVLRQASAVVVPLAVWAFCGLAVVDAVVEGTPGYLATVAAVMAAIAFATWLVLASPCLVVESEGLRIVNPVRVHWVPFAALDTVSVRGLTTVTLLPGAARTRPITSWNAPGVPRRYTAETAPVAAAVERARRAWEQRQRGGAPPALVATTWRWRPGLVLLLLVAANIAIWLR
jgi:hypothetical protein